MAKLAETALIMNTIDFSFQNNQNKAFEDPTIPRYSLKNQPEELGFSFGSISLSTLLLDTDKSAFNKHYQMKSCSSLEFDQVCF